MQYKQQFDGKKQANLKGGGTTIAERPNDKDRLQQFVNNVFALNRIFIFDRGQKR